MTEIDTSPEAYARYLATQNRIAKWVGNTEAHKHEFQTPAPPPGVTPLPHPSLRRRRSMVYAPIPGPMPVPLQPQVQSAQVPLQLRRSKSRPRLSLKDDDEVSVTPSMSASMVGVRDVLHQQQAQAMQQKMMMGYGGFQPQPHLAPPMPLGHPQLFASPPPSPLGSPPPVMYTSPYASPVYPSTVPFSAPAYPYAQPQPMSIQSASLGPIPSQGFVYAPPVNSLARQRRGRGHHVPPPLQVIYV